MSERIREGVLVGMLMGWIQGLNRGTSSPCIPSWPWPWYMGGVATPPLGGNITHWGDGNRNEGVEEVLEFSQKTGGWVLGLGVRVRV